MRPGGSPCRSFLARHEHTDAISAITVLVRPRSPAAWTEASIMNGHYARILMLGRAIGLGFGLGKIMLFRRSDLERAGGLHSIAWALGEDCALAEAMSGSSVFAGKG